MRHLVFALALCGGFFHGLAHAHDGYEGVFRHNRLEGPGVQLCCGGDPEKGDCEALTFEQVETVPEGVIITSKRYGATILVPSQMVEWSIPLDLRTKQPAFPTDPYAGHWCGKPRQAMASGYGASAPADDTQPDEKFWTFCAFVKAGGV